MGRCHGIDLGWAGQTFFFFFFSCWADFRELIFHPASLARSYRKTTRGHIYMWQPAVSQRTKTGQAKWPFAQVSRTQAGALEVELQGNRCEGWGRR